jgi:O-acetyl-ADP-ribose deacetylase (regulator of RNase III)
MQIQFIDGNVLDQQFTKPTILVHCVNDLGIFGAGIARAIANKWHHVEDAYCDLFVNPESIDELRLTAQGAIQIVLAEKDLWVCNLFGQSGVGDFAGMPAIRYGAIKEGFMRLRERLRKARKVGKVIDLVMPRIGCSLAGGKWSKIEEIIKEVFDKEDVEITVYTFGPYNK